MSTRALYTFRDQSSAWNVYKHHDGYPTGAACTIREAIDFYAWELPRFEADEFAAAFCAAGKVRYNPTETERQYTGGGVRLMPQGEPPLIAANECCDIQYRYEISMAPNGKKLIIKAIVGSWWDDPAQERVIFYGLFEDFERAAEQLNSVDDSYSIYETPKRKRRKPLVEHVSTGRPA